MRAFLMPRRLVRKSGQSMVEYLVIAGMAIGMLVLLSGPVTGAIGGLMEGGVQPSMEGAIPAGQTADMFFADAP